jgi:cell wall-associated NlpC family hydrolase
MFVPLRVAACATAVALTLTPEIAGSPAAAAEPAVVEIHHQDDQLRQHRERQELLVRRRHERHQALLRWRHTVRLKRARMIARWHVRADRAVRFSHRQRGKPYRWGGTGPRGYDCSGLVQRAWRAAGVSIPRVTHGQYRMRPRISRHRLRPGDLVFFHGRGHVGIYVGHRRFIHSPHAGSRVRVQRLRGHYRRAFVGAVRPAWPRLPKAPTRLSSQHHRHKPHGHRHHR